MMLMVEIEVPWGKFLKCSQLCGVSFGVLVLRRFEAPFVMLNSERDETRRHKMFLQISDETVTVICSEA